MFRVPPSGTGIKSAASPSFLSTKTHRLLSFNTGVLKYFFEELFSVFVVVCTVSEFPFPPFSFAAASSSSSP